MELSRNYKARLADEQKIKELQAIDPSWTVPKDPPQFISPYLNKIGIDYQSPVIGNGYIKLKYSDFIVEEIALNREIITINPHSKTEPHTETTVKKPRIGATLIKQGLSTFEAVERIAENLEIPTSDIDYAGLKDGRALTAQEISINKTDTSILESLQIQGLFLKDVHPRDGVLTPGSLTGNHFTIIVRTPENYGEAIARRTNELLSEGVLNFYSLQRFGTRLNSHIMGRLILQKKYEEAVMELLIGLSDHESFSLQNLRLEAVKYWGNWDKMIEVFIHLPYFFYNELRCLEALQRYPKYFDYALSTIQDQTKFFVQSYTSYCFNLLLSRSKSTGNLPDELPIISNTPESLKIYAELLPEGEVASLHYIHSALSFITLQKPIFVRTHSLVTVHSITQIDCGVIYEFDLNKGAYATNFLSQIFSLYQGQPVPDWVPQTEHDSRATLGLGSLKDTQSYFLYGVENIIVDTLE